MYKSNSACKMYKSNGACSRRDTCNSCVNYEIWKIKVRQEQQQNLDDKNNVINTVEISRMANKNNEFSVILHFSIVI